VQSPVISLVRVSSPMYWPSNLAKLCAHATLPSPVPSRRPSRRHLSIPFFPMIKADAETIEGISDVTVPGILPALAPMQGGQADALTDAYRNPQWVEGSSSSQTRNGRSRHPSGGGCSTATSSSTLSAGRQADCPPTEMFEEGAAVAICFAPEHCVPLET